MTEFDWEKFSSGVWYVTQKFATKSTCLTYEFKTDNLGFKSIEQVRMIPYTDKLGIDNSYTYTGKLYTPQESQPARMIVRFPLNLIGSANFLVMDTDYDNYAMVCTCQDVNLLFTFAHRRSCSILQRESRENMEYTKKMAILLDQQIPNASHDFDKISHDDCDYDSSNGDINIDVDKVLGLADDNLSDTEYEQFYGDYSPADVVEKAKDILRFEKF